MWVSGSEVIPSKGDRVMQFRTGGQFEKATSGTRIDFRSS